MMVHTSFFLFEGNKNDWEIESRIYFGFIFAH